jgi:hypothetical protein
MITIKKKFYKNFRSCPMGQFAAIHIYFYEEELVNPSEDIILQVRSDLVFQNKSDIPKDLRNPRETPGWTFPKTVRDAH